MLRTQPLFSAFDLGLDYERDDDQYIKEAIQTIESRFDLVLITDRFEESVILLKGTDFRSKGSGFESHHFQHFYRSSTGYDNIRRFLSFGLF